MAAAQPVTGYKPGSPRERAVSAFLSAAIIVLAALLAIYQTGAVAKFGKGVSLTAFDVASTGSAPKAAQAVPQKIEKASKTDSRPRSPMPKPRITIPNPQAPTNEDFGVPGFIHLTRAEMKAADIGNRKGAKSGTALAEGNGDSAAPGSGDGPGGARLYNPDWFREPTSAQLAGYLPKRNPGEGWGMIACQTAERHRVENCEILGESPGGSGYGRAVLDAAWQFQVIPPRINARSQIGAWVRIKITYSERGARAG
ncbi:hypothetical protein GKE62_03215 [Novosphingobium sp. Gsoil 351]|nr:hypothetical protein GKE62_03215 [Novosphingobium sp. Gsoil 351]